MEAIFSNICVRIGFGSWALLSLDAAVAEGKNSPTNRTQSNLLSRMFLLAFKSCLLTDPTTSYGKSFLINKIDPEARGGWCQL